MRRHRFVASLTLALVLPLSVGACGQDDSNDGGSGVEVAQEPAPTTTSPFDDVPVIRDTQVATVTRIAETVRARGGDEVAVLAALTASSAESDWRSGREKNPPPNGTDYRDVFGWPILDPTVGVTSIDAVVVGTNSFMDAASAVRPATTDPTDYAVAVQLGNPRGYDIEAHFPRREASESVDSLYADAAPKAESAMQYLVDEK